MVQIPEKLKKDSEIIWNSITIASHLEVEILGLLVSVYFKRTEVLPEGNDAIENMRIIQHHVLLNNDIAIKLYKLLNLDLRKHALPHEI
jgi:hypothetical protein